MRFVDCHAHLNFKAFAWDFPLAIKRSRKAGLVAIVNVGTEIPTSQKALRIAHDFEDNFAAIGFHPIHVNQRELDWDFYHSILSDSKVVAIGEVGLDLFRNAESLDEQKLIFRKFLELAKAKGKPVIIHTRKAYAETLEILQDLKPAKAVMHCFMTDWDYARKLLDLGMFISFTGIITTTKDQKILESATKIPLDRILIETDSPYLTPLAHQGERNEPAFVVEVAKKLAQLRNLSLEEVSRSTTQNAIDFFNLPIT